VAEVVDLAPGHEDAGSELDEVVGLQVRQQSPVDRPLDLGRVAVGQGEVHGRSG
jgi:hypothetical protein